MTTTTTMLDLTIVNHSTVGNVPNDAQFSQWFTYAVGELYQQSDVDLLLVDEDRMAEINLQVRGKTGPTNTLAMPFQEDNPDTPLFGEIIMCPQVIQQQAQARGLEITAHWAHLFVHSTLHLLGFDHQDDAQAEHMEAREREILQQLGFDDPYS